MGLKCFFNGHDFSILRLGLSPDEAHYSVGCSRCDKTIFGKSNRIKVFSWDTDYVPVIKFHRVERNFTVREEEEDGTVAVEDT